MKNITRKDIIIYNEVRNYLEAESKRIFDYILKVIPKVNPNTQNETLRSWRVEGNAFSLLYSYIDIKDLTKEVQQPIMASFDLPVATVIDQNWKRWLDIQAKQIKQEMEEKKSKETNEEDAGE
jgi:regulator of sigma D